jgi:hypothetical protein
MTNEPKQIATLNSLAQKVVKSPQRPITVNEPLLLADTEYTYELPIGTSKFSIKLRSENAQLRIYLSTENDSSQSGNKYITIPAGSSYWAEDLNTEEGTTIYMQTDTAIQVAEIVVWRNLHS